MKSLLRMMILSVLVFVTLGSVCSGTIRYGAYSDILGGNCGLIMNIDKWDVQLTYSTVGVGSAATSRYGVAGTYYFTSVRSLDFGWLMEYTGDSDGVTNILLGGTVKTPLIGEISIKADAYVLGISSGGVADGTALFPAGARIAFVIMI